MNRGAITRRARFVDDSSPKRNKLKDVQSSPTAKEHPNMFLFGGTNYGSRSSPSPTTNTSKYRKRFNRMNLRRFVHVCPPARLVVFLVMALALGILLYIIHSNFGNAKATRWFHIHKNVYTWKNSFIYLNQTYHLVSPTLRQDSSTSTSSSSSHHYDSYKNTLSVIEEIIPVWFHRNDIPKRTLENIPSHAIYSHCTHLQNMSSFTITLVIQTSVERLFLLSETCIRWKSPMVVVIYYNTSTTSQTHVDTLVPDEIHSLCSQVTWIPYYYTPPTKLLLEEEKNPTLYPINQLRNIGLDQVHTSHVLVMDIDFIPSMNLDTVIQSILQKKDSTTTTSSRKKAWVIPALEYHPPSSFTDSSLRKNNNKKNPPLSSIPQNIHQLYSCYFTEKKCSIFQGDVNWEGHSTTRTESWLQRRRRQQQVDADVKEDDKESVISCLDSPRYEPYLVLPWCSKNTSSSSPASPYYDERFHGYGKNKIQHVQHVRFVGYSFHVLPGNGFIIHYPHEISQSKYIWNRKDEFKLHEQMDQLYPQFLQELSILYPETLQNRIPYCKSS